MLFYDGLKRDDDEKRKSNFAMCYIMLKKRVEQKTANAEFLTRKKKK